MRATTKPELRVLGTREMLLESIRKQAEADLGLKIRYIVLDGMAALQRAISAPDSFDVYDQWHAIDLAWTARAIQPLAVERIALWGEIVALSLHGRFDALSSVGHGDVPARQLWVQPDGRLGSRPSPFASMVPTVHNADAPGFLPAAREILGQDAAESWAWLLDDRVAGRVAIMRDPSLGVIECALAAQAAGLADFRDMGNLSIDEIDVLIEILIAKKRSGHFRGFWSAYEDSVQLVERGVAVGSIWSPAVTALRARNWPIRILNPKEGYRGWHSGLCLSSRARSRTLDAAYDYLNWWLTGWAGAQLARQGYYMSIPERTRPHLTADEWNYWYEGEPAAGEIRDNFGSVVARSRERREGGSYRERMSRIAVWNSFMDEHNYLVRRWSEFLLA